MDNNPLETLPGEKPASEETHVDTPSGASRHLPHRGEGGVMCLIEHIKNNLPAAGDRAIRSVSAVS
jgi:hypothetical protein